ncbi:hypothetical protein FQR65_LT04476 [Abscondita terminalis]|nr:hypothetical protein FQR65_LT04476 [Abscondita terminalis]
MDKSETLEMVKEMHKQMDSGEKFSADSLQKLASLLDNLELTDDEKQDLGGSLNDLMSKLKAFSGPTARMGGMDITGDGNLLMQITLVIAFVVMVSLFGQKMNEKLTAEQLLNDSFKQITDIVEKLRSMSTEEQVEYLKEVGFDKPSDDSQSTSTISLNNYVLFATCFSLIILFFVFFGYKLYQSLTEKERKRDEKRKQKQMKKKK